jgi:hypothetical protein
MEPPRQPSTLGWLYILSEILFLGWMLWEAGKWLVTVL